MTTDQYFQQVLDILQRRIGQMVGRGEVRVQEVDDVIQFFCEWLLARPRVMETYTPAAIVSVAVKQRLVEFIRQQNRQNPTKPYNAAAIEPSMFMEYLDEAGWGPSGYAPTFAVPLKEFEDGDNDHSNQPALIDRLHSNQDVARDVEHDALTQSMLTALDPLQREVFTLVNLEGFTVTEAAQSLGIRRERASIALQRARRIVKDLRRDWDV